MYKTLPVAVVNDNESSGFGIYLSNYEFLMNDGHTFLTDAAQRDSQGIVHL